MKHLIGFLGLSLAAMGCSEHEFIEIPPTDKIGDLTLTGRACDSVQHTWLDGALVYTHLIDDDGRLYHTSETTTNEDGFWELERLIPNRNYTVYIQSGSTLVEVFDIQVEEESLELNDPDCSGSEEFEVAVITGDYDDFEEVLGLLGVGTYDLINGLTGSDLADFLSSETSLARYDVIFFPGGHVEEDILYDLDGSDTDGVVGAVHTTLSNYVNNGGVIYASDWSYDVVEQLWPDRIEFLGEDTSPDDAQIGTEASVLASVTDDNLSTYLSSSSAEVVFDLDTYPVVESVTGGVRVLMRADIPYRIGMDVHQRSNSPILMSFPEGEGRVIFSTWRQASNTDGDAMEVIRFMMSGI